MARQRSDGAGVQDGTAGGTGTTGRTVRRRTPEPRMRAPAFQVSGARGGRPGGLADPAAEHATWNGSYADGSTTSGRGLDGHDTLRTQFAVALSMLERKMDGVQEEFEEVAHRLADKAEEKFDLIHEILTDMRDRQVEIEDNIRGLKVQLEEEDARQTGCVGAAAGQWPQVVPGKPGQVRIAAASADGDAKDSQPSQRTEPSGSLETGGQVSGQMPCAAVAYPPAGWHAGGAMPCDAQQQHWLAPVPQMYVFASPTASGVQYGMPQMVAPVGSMQGAAPQLDGAVNVEGDSTVGQMP